MNIGITYDLKSDYLKMGFSEEEVAEFDTEETVEGIENALKSLGYETNRIGHVKNLIQLIQQGKRWDLVFNICEGLKGSGREAQVPAVLDIYDIPYTFSDVCIMSLTLNKAFTKHIVKNAGFKTADFQLIHHIGELESINLPYPLFVKPALEGTGKGIDETSLVNNKNELFSACLQRFNNGYTPLLIEEFLSGREFTVGIIGSGENCKAVGAMEVVFNKHKEDNIYSFDTKAHYENLVKYSIPEDSIVQLCAEMAVGIWKLLGCYDAGRIDVRMDRNGVLNFIEINPLAGLNLIHSDLPIICRLNGISFQTLIQEIVDAAKLRYNLNK
ncbi:MAG: ATP-grasp domain-containing protein [Bacteroidales bacterium]|nr:ATP-grasp domain-containing protein [Bacteroidales bacterium]